MWFLKLHIAVSVVYFITMIGTVVFFNKQLTDNLAKLGRVSDKRGIKKQLANIKGIAQFFLVSFVPVVRLAIVAVIFALIFCDAEMFEFLRKQEEADDA